MQEWSWDIQGHPQDTSLDLAWAGSDQKGGRVWQLILTAKGLQQCVTLDGWWALWHHPPSQTLISHPVQCHPKHPGTARQWGAPGLSPPSLISAWPNADAERYVCEVMGKKNRIKHQQKNPSSERQGRQRIVEKLYYCLVTNYNCSSISLEKEHCYTFTLAKQHML